MRKFLILIGCVFSSVTFAKASYNCKCTAEACGQNTNVVKLTIEGNYQRLTIDGVTAIKSGVPQVTYMKGSKEIFLQLGNDYLKFIEGGNILFNGAWTCTVSSLN